MHFFFIYLLTVIFELEPTIWKYILVSIPAC